jgi:hypothetical protein
MNYEYKYKSEKVNGLVVKSEISGNVMLRRFKYRITWDDERGRECGEEGYGYRSLDSCEAAMAETFKRAVLNGRIGGKPATFSGFPVTEPR